MKKNFFLMGALLVGLSLSTVSCSDDDTDAFAEAANLDYAEANADSWCNYMRNVALLLQQDASDLDDAWRTSYNGGEAYATTFKNHNSATFSSAVSCVEQIIDGCSDIANEVGTSKIGEPYNYYKAGQTTQALYAVESWYSWHSRDDYTNNIYSIRNAYYGTRDGSVATNSLYNYVNSLNPTLNTQVVAAITNAAEAIQAIPQPFRNNIASTQSQTAMTACETLETLLDKTLKPFLTENDDETAYDAIITQYVDAVVLPTYADLKTKNAALYNTVVAFCNNPSNAGFEACAEAWLEARQPWEQSEAFLFGPVDALGLDPNMDSWPLDQVAIVNILKSNSWSSMEWSDDDSDEAIESAQNVRGFHTLEYLVFKDGEARTIE
ncbi:MAG: imelysin family protein [Bacteroidales bacterium]|nr:imelysin family protein [Bacteroidales bacterium]